jgi:hypothetical protein
MSARTLTVESASRRHPLSANTTRRTAENIAHRQQFLEKQGLGCRSKTVVVVWALMVLSVLFSRYFFFLFCALCASLAGFVSSEWSFAYTRDGGLGKAAHVGLVPRTIEEKKNKKKFPLSSKARCCVLLQVNAMLVRGHFLWQPTAISLLTRFFLFFLLFFLMGFEQVCSLEQVSPRVWYGCQPRWLL